MTIEKNVVIYGDCWFRAPWNITIGRGTVVGDGCKLDGRNGLVIGENVNMSTAVFIYTEQHDVNDPYFESGRSGGKVVIGNRAWLSSRTTVLPKVCVGEGAVLASGALASKDLEAFGIYGGVPAKKIGQRSRDLRYEFDGSALPFF
ncbi:MAG: acyltransferase [Lachnospiraceae bacterium]|nr:acyltransferase [Lachnospiraceae bacterium]